MSAPTLAAPTQAAPVLDLDMRLVLVGAAMNVRLDTAHADMLIRTAGIPIPDVEIGPPTLVTDGRPIARLLERAARRLAAAGWSRDTAITGAGAICPLWAIHLEAGGPAEEGEARTLLLTAIRVGQPDVVSIPWWNSRQASGAAAVRMLQQAAGLAHGRGL